MIIFFRYLLAGGTAVDRCPDAFFGNNCLQFHYNSRASKNDKICSSVECNGCTFVIDISPIEAVNGMLIE